MSFRPYSTLVLVPSNVQDEGLLTRVGARLTELQGKPVTIRAENGIHVLDLGEYQFHWSDFADAAEDREVRGEVLQQVGQPHETPDMFTHTLSITGAKADPSMDFFNAAVYLWETVERELPGCVLFDTNSGERL